MNNNSLSYRRDVDGLRAIAVLSVVGYHAFPQWIPGGFVGVDIFFVISGFLISSIILKSSAKDGFSVMDFYNRRIRRIFPALITMFTICLLFGWLLLFPDELQQLGKHTLGAVFFVSNFVFWSEAGYFDNASELKPLLHLWSLSIEEQFYALWPLTLLLFLKSKRAIWYTLILTVASFSLCVSGQLNSVANFYMPLTRIWELLCGALLAFIPANNQHATRITFNNARLQFAAAEIFSLTGIILLVMSIFFVLNNKSIFPGWASLLPTLGAALLIAGGPGTFINRYALSNRVFVFIGLISYPLYLWHWPFLAFPKITDGLALPTMTKLAALTMAAIFAVLTYRYIEMPLRHRGKYVSLALFLIALLIGVTGYLCKMGIIHPMQTNKLTQKISEAKTDYPLYGKEVLSHTIIVDGFEYYEIGGGTKTTLFIGDSNMAQYWPGVESVTTTRGNTRKALLAAHTYCPPILHIALRKEDPAANDPVYFTFCTERKKHAYAMALRNHDIDTVVIAANWLTLFAFNFVEAGSLYSMETPEGMTRALNQLTSTIRELRSHGKTVYLLLNIPPGEEFEHHYLIKRSLSPINILPSLNGGISMEEYRNRTQRISPEISAVARNSGAILLDPVDFLCHDRWCSAVTPEGDPIYRDSDHLRGSFIRHHPEFIGQTLK